MDEPKVLKRPQRATAGAQARVLEALRNSPIPESAEVGEDAPAPDDETADEAEQEPCRFDFSPPGHVVTSVDDETGFEYCAAVVDGESQRVWLIATWPKPPKADALPDVAKSYCLVVGTKRDATERLSAMTGAPAAAQRSNKQKDARSAHKPAYSGTVTRQQTRVQQKQG